MTSVAPIRVPADALRSLVEECFTGLRIPPADALAVADALAYADLRGLDAHGIHRVPAYIQRVRLGLAGGTDALAEIGGSGAVRRLDAKHALGPAAAIRAADRALELADEHGIGMVALGRSTHFGAAGFYGRRVARRGMIALIASNGPKGVAPHGSSEPFTGTNPLAIGIPLGRHGEFVLDMSTSAIPRERVRRAAALGEALPERAAIDASGRPTTDASQALEGSVLPVGGPKGSGLGVAITLMVGLLGGADFDFAIGSMAGDLDRTQNVGQLFVVIDPSRLLDRETFARRATELVEALHSLRPAEGFERVLFSGERGDALALERQRDGIPVPPAELERVATACEQADLVWLAERARSLARSR